MSWLSPQSQKMFQAIRHGELDAVKKAAGSFDFSECGEYGPPLMTLLSVDMWLPDEMNDGMFQWRYEVAEFLLAKGANPLQHAPPNCPHHASVGDRYIPLACNSARSLVSNLQAMWQTMVPQILQGALDEEEAQLLIQEMTQTGDRLRSFEQLLAKSSLDPSPRLPYRAPQGMQQFVGLWARILKDEASADVQLIGEDADQVVPAHAFVLSKASPVLAQKLHEQSEASPKKIFIPASATAIQGFLRLIYTGSLEEAAWPAIEEVVAIARVAANMQTWFVLPPLVRQMRCCLSSYSFCVICKFAMDYRQDTLLSDCEVFVTTLKAKASKEEWVSWTIWMAGQDKDVQDVVRVASSRGGNQLLL
mmetsp:Transcript_42202/g.78501  ORF Transcript_42202/g.78501 Transcript_42202/m.78501 type:complete len:362 (+) Transcript_42202:39-1124(+)